MNGCCCCYKVLGYIKRQKGRTAHPSADAEEHSGILWVLERIKRQGFPSFYTLYEYTHKQNYFKGSGGGKVGNAALHLVRHGIVRVQARRIAERCGGVIVLAELKVGRAQVIPCLE
jgi:hypothetical protein